MNDVAIRSMLTTATKPIRKHASKKARRRHDIEETVDSLLASIDEPETPDYPEDPLDQQAPFCVMVWDDGLDYNEDGTSYQDDCPGDWPHSYHLTRKDAETAVAYLEHSGCEPHRITIVENFWVPHWDAKRIPERD